MSVNRSKNHTLRSRFGPPRGAKWKRREDLEVGDFANLSGYWYEITGSHIDGEGFRIFGLERPGESCENSLLFVREFKGK